MKTISIAALSVFLVTSLFSATPDQRQLLVMANTVEVEGTGAFDAKIHSEGWANPLIPSRWHLEKIATQDEQAEMIMARDFGYKLAQSLSSRSFSWLALVP